MISPKTKRKQLLAAIRLRFPCLKPSRLDSMGDPELEYLLNHGDDWWALMIQRDDDAFFSRLWDRIHKLVPPEARHLTPNCSDYWCEEARHLWASLDEIGEAFYSVSSPYRMDGKPPSSPADLASAPP
jgi:hypothetical protein